ncbi:MAG: hypothetical protein IKK06_09250 [Clostridia bacterium]|nr:hypothetical protein [Clostridia bacterium]
MFKKLSVFTLFICLLCAMAGCTGEEPKEGSSMEVSFILEVSSEAVESYDESSILPDESYQLQESGEVPEESSDLPDGELYHRDPFHPNDKTPVVVPDDFPAISLFTDGTAEREEHTYAFTENYLVTGITEEGFYGTTLLSHEANAFIFGSYEGIAVGDYVRFKNADYHLTIKGSRYFHAFPAETVKDLRVLDEEDLEDIFAVKVPEKPVIYLYPEEETVISVKLDYKGDLTCTYPHYQGGKGWEDLTVSPDGTIKKDGREYYCLYWEGRGIADYDFSRGFCVKGEDSGAFLEQVLPVLGLTAREANEFIIYWLPRLEANPYNVIAFQKEAYTETAPLVVSPTPDSMLRVFMAFYGCNSYVEMVPQEFEEFHRVGFTVVEWGGAEVKK